MLPYSVSYYGNPHSRTHAYGWQAEDAVEDARKQVADLINVSLNFLLFLNLFFLFVCFDRNLFRFFCSVTKSFFFLNSENEVLVYKYVGIYTWSIYLI